MGQGLFSCLLAYWERPYTLSPRAAPIVPVAMGTTPFLPGRRAAGWQSPFHTVGSRERPGTCSVWKASPWTHAPLCKTARPEVYTPRKKNSSHCRPCKFFVLYCSVLKKADFCLIHRCISRTNLGTQHIFSEHQLTTGTTAPFIGLP